MVLYNFISRWPGEIKWDVAYKQVRYDRWLMEHIHCHPEDIWLSITIRNRDWKRLLSGGNDVEKEAVMEDWKRLIAVSSSEC